MAAPGHRPLPGEGLVTERLFAEFESDVAVRARVRALGIWPGQGRPGGLMASEKLRRASTTLAATLGALLTACVAQGPSYQEVTAATPLADGETRLVFLRPKDSDDGANGGSALIHVDRETVGKLAYGGFLHVDRAPGPISIRVSGRYQTFGACEMRLDADAGDTIYVDVGPRMSYMVASLLGSVAGGLIGSAVVPAPEVVSATAEVVLNTSTVADAAGSAAGQAAAIAIEGGGRDTCAGPYRLGVMSEGEALRLLQGLARSE